MTRFSRLSWAAPVLVATALLGTAWAVGCGNGNGNALDNGGECTGETCACPVEGATAECAETVAYTPGADSATCRSGTRTCSGGQWGACVGNSLSFQSVSIKSTTSTKCLDNPCDPYCKQFDDSSKDIDGGSVVTTTDGGGITITPGASSGSDAASGDGGKKCIGLQCQIDGCGGDYKKTTITGTVYDPAGKNVIYNALVYVPNTTPAKVSEGASCDTCAAGSGDPVVSALTGPDGKFELKGVPSGKGIPLVMQVGKWRRQVKIDVTPCGANNVTDINVTRLPKNRTEGDIPRIAFVSGSADPFQCLFVKMGIDVNTEVSIPYAKVGGAFNPQRIHYYNSPYSAGNDLSTALGGGAPKGDTLWNSTTNLNKYDVVILACEGGENDKGTAYTQNMVDYAAGGGRIFATHFSYAWLQFASATSQWPNVTMAWNHAGYPSDPVTARLDTSFPKGSAFATWLVNVGASSTAGQLVLNESRHDFDKVDPTRSTRWMSAWSDDSAALPTGIGTACFDGSTCAAGTNCNTTAAGVCAQGNACTIASGCSTNLKICTATGDCGGDHASCRSPAGSVCKNAVTVGKTTTYYTDKCASNFCADGTACTKDADCAPATTKTCTADTDCKGGYKCWAYNKGTTIKACMTKKGSSYYTGICDNQYCKQSTCTKDSDCGGTYDCVDGSCVEGHNIEPLMTFNTPVGVAADKQCGRVVFSDFHVSANALTGSSSKFPDNCKTGDLSAQEKALEFMLFDLSACLSPDYEPPAAPPPKPPFLDPITVTRDYTAECKVGEHVVWRFFDWKTHTPDDSAINFRVQTGDTIAALIAMTPRKVATVTGPTITTWTGVDISKVLASAPTVKNGKLLRMSMELVPTSDGKQAPVLDAWRQAFDCVADE